MPCLQGEREHIGGIHMNWSIVANVILVILLILVVVLAVLYFLGRKMEKRQVEQQSAIDAAKQTVSLMAIDKKKLKIKEAGLPPIVYEQTPWYAKWMKVPVVKAKIGTKIMTSADIPIVVPKTENNSRNAGITKYSRPRKAFAIFLQRTVRIPVDVMISKDPPMIRINVTVLAAFTIAL